VAFISGKKLNKMHSKWILLSISLLSTLAETQRARVVANLGECFYCLKTFSSFQAIKFFQFNRKYFEMRLCRIAGNMAKTKSNTTRNCALAAMKLPDCSTSK